MTETEVMERWGTWEELVLGGAILKHGTQDWNLVASELRARTVYPYLFTPQACKAKYEDLQERYSTGWFEELRKQRIAELRRSLELSEDSIGFLQSRLEALKTEKRENYRVDYDSSQTESPISLQRSYGFESSSKDICKDGLSAGSFTQETKSNWFPKCRIHTMVPSEEADTKPQHIQSFESEKVSGAEKPIENIYRGRIGSLKRRRGKRKRKDCSASVSETDLLGSANILTTTPCNENLMSDSGQIVRSSGFDDQRRGSRKDGLDILMRVYSYIIQYKFACVFRRRLDSQKRGRYKKMIRWHMDFDTIRSRIVSRSIMSPKELFRDMLLLANNALVFYSKTTREHKSARLLRDLVTQTLHQHFTDHCSKSATAIFPFAASIHKPPVKPRSVRTGKRKSPGKAGNVAVRVTSEGSGNVDSPFSIESSAVTKKSISRARKAAREGFSQGPGTSSQARKRIWLR